MPRWAVASVDGDMPPNKSIGPMSFCCHQSFKALVVISTPSAWTTCSLPHRRTCRLWCEPSFSGGSHSAAAIHRLARSDQISAGLAYPSGTDVYAIHAHNRRRRAMLDELMAWRNAIAHNDFDPAVFGSAPILHLQQIRRWRSALTGLSDGFDRVLRDHLTGILGVAPW